MRRAPQTTNTGFSAAVGTRRRRRWVRPGSPGSARASPRRSAAATARSEGRVRRDRRRRRAAAGRARRRAPSSPPPPTNTRSGSGRSAERRGAAPLTTDDAPCRAALAPMRSQRLGVALDGEHPQRRAPAGRPRSPTLPLPAPTSHSTPCGGRPSLPSATARTSALVIMPPRWANVGSSPRPSRGRVASAPRRARARRAPRPTAGRTRPAARPSRSVCVTDSPARPAGCTPTRRAARSRRRGRPAERLGRRVGATPAPRPCGSRRPRRPRRRAAGRGTSRSTASSQGSPTRAKASATDDGAGCTASASRPEPRRRAPARCRRTRGRRTPARTPAAPARGTLGAQFGELVDAAPQLDRRRRAGAAGARSSCWRADADEHVGVAQRRLGPGAEPRCRRAARRRPRGRGHRCGRACRLGRPAVEPLRLGRRNDVLCAGDVQVAAGRHRRVAQRVADEHEHGAVARPSSGWPRRARPPSCARSLVGPRHPDDDRGRRRRVAVAGRAARPASSSGRAPDRNTAIVTPRRRERGDALARPHRRRGAAGEAGAAPRSATASGP